MYKIDLRCKKGTNELPQAPAGFPPSMPSPVGAKKTWTPHRCLWLALAAALCAQPQVSQAAEANTAEAKPAAKFIIGPIIASLLSSFASNAMQALVAGQAAPAQQPNTQPAPQGNAPCYFSQNGSGISQLLLTQLLQTGCQALAQGFAPPQPGVSQYLTPLQQTPQVQPQLSYYPSGAPNYQGVKVTVLMTDQAGNTIGERPVGSAFYSGEQFRLKIQPTFSGLLEIDHIDPLGVRRQLFPKAGMGAFMVAAGKELTLPLGNAVYEFDTERGNEQLIFKVRDPRITRPGQYGGTMMTQEVGRSTFLGQNIAENGQFPYISQSVDIRHH